MEVYDRWGNLLFRSSRATTGWDGTFREQEMELGVYLVHLNYQFENLERSISKVETVTIFREQRDLVAL